jgi:N-acetyl-gamma-glutamyl-phosphate reductase
MIQAGIIGGSGYTGGELIRILLNHSKAQVNFVYSTTKAGLPISDAHEDLLGLTDLKFTSEINPEVDVLFLCLGHGNSKSFLNENSFSDKTKIIDLSNDFRLKKDVIFEGREFVYGLPELQKEKIKSAKHIANPGCFATAIQLALLPLANNGLLKDEVHVNAITGSTGAGIKPSDTTHFSWRNNNISWYKPFTHQHLGEIHESIELLQNSKANVYFIPNRGNFPRGILATCYTKFEGSLEDALKIYTSFYNDALALVDRGKRIQMTGRNLASPLDRGQTAVGQAIGVRVIAFRHRHSRELVQLPCGTLFKEGVKLLRFGLGRSRPGEEGENESGVDDPRVVHGCSLPRPPAVSFGPRSGIVFALEADSRHDERCGEQGGVPFPAQSSFRDASSSAEHRPCPHFHCCRPPVGVVSRAPTIAY